MKNYKTSSFFNFLSKEHKKWKIIDANFSSYLTSDVPQVGVILTEAGFIFVFEQWDLKLLETERKNVRQAGRVRGSF